MSFTNSTGPWARCSPRSTGSSWPTNTLVIFTSDNGGAIKNTYDDGTNPLHGRQKPNGAAARLQGLALRGRASRAVHRALARPHPGRRHLRRSSWAMWTRWPLSPRSPARNSRLMPARTASTCCPPAWRRRPPRRPRDHLVLQNNGQRPLALREGNWVLIETGRRRPGAVSEPVYELYDLAIDPGQARDLAATQTDRVATMLKRLVLFRERGRTRP